MGCTINIDYTIFKDKIIVLAFIFIIMLSILLIFMIKSDTPVQVPAAHNHTTIITRWTIIPEEGEENCTTQGSAFGGSGPNGSIHGSCHLCNCSSKEIRDII